MDVFLIHSEGLSLCSHSGDQVERLPSLMPHFQGCPRCGHGASRKGNFFKGPSLEMVNTTYAYFLLGRTQSHGYT